MYDLSQECCSRQNLCQLIHRQSSEYTKTPSSGSTHLAERDVLRGENSRLLAAPETLFLPVVLPCCLRPEPGAVRGLNMPAVIPRTAQQSISLSNSSNLTVKINKYRQHSLSHPLQTARGAVAWYIRHHWVNGKSRPSPKWRFKKKIIIILLCFKRTFSENNVYCYYNNYFHYFLHFNTFPKRAPDSLTINERTSLYLHLFQIRSLRLLSWVSKTL